MDTKERFDKRYKAQNTPWDLGRVDFNLEEALSTLTLPGNRTLDIGCGTGDNVIWMAKQGFDATGIDSSETALEMAKQKAARAAVTAEFICLDILHQKLPSSTFSLAFDRGCLHACTDQEERKRFAHRIFSCLADHGLWLSLSGSADDTKEPHAGPPRLKAADIVCTVEEYFEIICLKSTFFGSDSPAPPKAWSCLLRKRSY